VSEDSLKVTLDHPGSLDHLMKKQAGMIFSNATPRNRQLVEIAFSIAER
jgi:hypothetical protein